MKNIFGALSRALLTHPFWAKGIARVAADGIDIDQLRGAVQALWISGEWIEAGELLAAYGLEQVLCRCCASDTLSTVGVRRHTDAEYFLCTDCLHERAMERRRQRFELGLKMHLEAKDVADEAGFVREESKEA